MALIIFILTTLFGIFLLKHMKSAVRFKGIITSINFGLFNFLRTFSIFVLIVFILLFYPVLFGRDVGVVEHLTNIFTQNISKYGTLGVIPSIMSLFTNASFIFIALFASLILFFPNYLIRKSAYLKSLSRIENEKLIELLTNIQNDKDAISPLKKPILPRNIYICKTIENFKCRVFGKNPENFSLIINEDFYEQILNKRTLSTKDKFILLHEIGHVANGDIPFSTIIQLAGNMKITKTMLIILFVPYVMMYLSYQIVNFAHYKNTPITWRLSQMLISAKGFLYLLVFAIILFVLRYLVILSFRKTQRRVEEYADLRALLFFPVDFVPIKLLRERLIDNSEQRNILRFNKLELLLDRYISIHRNSSMILKKNSELILSSLKIAIFLSVTSLFLYYFWGVVSYSFGDLFPDSINFIGFLFVVFAVFVLVNDLLSPFLFLSSDFLIKMKNEPFEALVLKTANKKLFYRIYSILVIPSIILVFIPDKLTDIIILNRFDWSNLYGLIASTIGIPLMSVQIFFLLVIKFQRNNN